MSLNIAAVALPMQVVVGSIVYVGWLMLAHRRSVMDSLRFISHVRSRDKETSVADAAVAAAQI